jgi:hypothetical protein
MIYIMPVPTIGKVRIVILPPVLLQTLLGGNLYNINI